jgi:C-terminal processing protease CtpA/Prc
MKRFIYLIAPFLLIISFVSCSDNSEDIPQELEVHDFVWRGLNTYYFWKADVPSLEEFNYKNQKELNNFLDNFSTPTNLFENLIFDRQNTDKWSVIFDDFITLENLLNGISVHNGMEFGLVHVSNNNTDIFGYVRYVLPNSDAVNKGVTRGMIFNSVNGTALTINNYRSLLFSGATSYSIELATYNTDGTVTSITPTQSIALDKTELQENPIRLTNIITQGSHKIGYLMYNGFYRSFNGELNNVIGQLKSQGITDLVLDLRYNGGGSVLTSSYLASMLTGQFTGQIYSKEHWNDAVQSNLEKNNPASLVNNYVDIMNDNTPINHLNLDKIYILTTRSTASASELVINSLIPYITVKTIGSKTVGKYVASITLYDSPNFGRQGANPNHTYAMQPIVLEELNKLGENDKDGFDPTVPLREDYANLGILGDANEPLFKAAIDLIVSGNKSSSNRVLPIEEPFTGSKEVQLKNTMTVDKKLEFIPKF